MDLDVPLLLLVLIVMETVIRMLIVMLDYFVTREILVLILSLAVLLADLEMSVLMIIVMNKIQ